MEELEKEREWKRRKELLKQERAQKKREEEGMPSQSESLEVGSFARSEVVADLFLCDRQSTRTNQFTATATASRSAR